MPRLSALLVLSLAAALPARAAEAPAAGENAAVENAAVEKASTVEKAAPVEKATPADAVPDAVPPAVDVTTAAPRAEAPAAAPAVRKASEDAQRNRRLYIVRHAVMGAGIGGIAAIAVAVVGTASVLYLLPRMGGDEPTTFEKMLPIEWRRSVSTALFLGVLPGLALLTACAAAATGISAYRDRASFRGE
jgi:hypothetical protein